VQLTIIGASVVRQTVTAIIDMAIVYAHRLAGRHLLQDTSCAGRSKIAEALMKKLAHIWT
jgi:hypothetical protein